MSYEKIDLLFWFIWVLGLLAVGLIVIAAFFMVGRLIFKSKFVGNLIERLWR